MIKMSDKEYFKIDALSNSDFRLLKESALHLQNKEYFELEGDSLSLGSAVHKLVLEPDHFNDEYIIEEFEGHDLNKNSTKYKEARSKFLEQSEGKTVLSSDKFEKITKMARNVNAIAGGLLQDGLAEMAFFSEIDGIKVKCKVDYYRENLGIMFDLKTTASIKDFRKSILEYGYFTQAPYYIDVVKSSGKRAERFIFILVETVKPYMVSVQEIDRESIEEGRAVYSELMGKWRDFKQTGRADVLKTTGLPFWYLEKARQGR
jgi:exodeoxyribonuclease VIII